MTALLIVASTALVVHGCHLWQGRVDRLRADAVSIRRFAQTRDALR